MSNAVLDLDRLLDDERHLLLAGDIANLEPIAEAKNDLIERLMEHQGEFPDSLRQKLNRNRDLLQSAINGISGARRRLGEFRQVRDCLSFYTKQGERRDIRMDGARRLSSKA